MELLKTKDCITEISVTPVHPRFGAEITGIDLNQTLSGAHSDTLRNLLLEHKLLIFRHQDISRDTQVAFARQFGALRPGLPSPRQHPEITLIYHGPGYPPLGTDQWHSDWSASEQPTLGIVLRAVEVPPLGGDTLFADMTAAYAGLPDEIKERIQSLTALHDMGDYTTAIASHASITPHLPTLDQSHHHPVIRHHPETGAPILYVNRLFTRSIDGLPPTASDALLTYLFEQAATPEYQYRHHWLAGDVVFWDNRATQHYAIADYRPHVRKLEAVSIVGTRNW